MNKIRITIKAAAVLIALCFIGLVYSPLLPAQTSYVDGILAVVEGEVITISRVMQETAVAEMQLARTLPRQEYADRVHRLRSETLDRLIDNKLIYREFKERGHQIPETFIVQHLNRIILQEADGDRAEFEAMLREEGLRLEDFREQVKRQMAVELMLEEEVRRYGNVTEAQIKRFYEENRHQFRIPEKIKAQIIFIDGRNRSAGELQQIAERVRMRLQRDDDFSLIAAEFSDDRQFLQPSWIDVEQLHPRLAAMADRLPLQAVSPPVTVAAGIYFIRIEEKEGQRMQKLAAVQNVIRDVLSRYQQQEKYKHFLASLRRKFYVRVYE